MFDKILIANRGEIALRVHRACKEMGISTVAVHSEADAGAMWVRLADESVCIGPPPAAKSYLNIPAIIAAAEITGAQAIHPGYGFLSENARFAEIVEAHGFTFIGPKPEHIRMMGDKITAKQAVKDAGIPVVPGSDGALTTEEEAFAAAEEIGFPVLIKAAAGGGGRGMKVAQTTPTSPRPSPPPAPRPRRRSATTRSIWSATSRRRGTSSCRYRRQLRQRLPPGRTRLLAAAPPPEGDGRGPLARPSTPPRAPRSARWWSMRSSIGYLGVGTIEFLYENGEFFFIEMNTRLQVEHPVTEAITGIDLVREQIRIAAGLPLSFTPGGRGLRGPRHRVPDQRREPEDLRALARPGHRLPRAGRPGRAAG